jgi:predicted branched-subunit amino acid permease
MSIAIYAGAAQFAVLDLWHAPLPLAEYQRILSGLMMKVVNP